MKKIVALFLAVCSVAGLSACGQEPAPPLPNELATPQYSIKLAPETDFATISEEEIHSAGDIKVVGEAKTETPLSYLRVRQSLFHPKIEGVYTP